MVALVAVKVLRSLNGAKVAVTKINMKHIEVALEQYKLNHGSYPTTEQGLSALVTESARDAIPGNIPSDRTLKRLPTDGWGHKFIFNSPGLSGHEYDLISFGADQKEGGEGINADITYIPGV